MIKVQPSALNTRNSRYTFGGTTEINGDMLGYWEPASTDSLRTYTEIKWTIPSAFAGRPDLIANKFYGTVSLGWLILQHNKIVDDIEELVEGTVISIPDSDRVTTGLTSLKASENIRTL